MHEFNTQTLEKICQTLNCALKQEGDHFRFALLNEVDSERRLSLEIYPGLSDQKHQGALIVVYTPNSHLQLHHCQNIVVSESMGEVTFISEGAEQISAIVIEETGGCSFYAQVDRSALSGDYEQLGVEVMLAGLGSGLLNDLDNQV